MKISKEALLKLIREEYNRLERDSFDFEEYDNYEKDYQDELDSYIRISIKNSDLIDIFKNTLKVPEEFKDKIGNEYKLHTKKEFYFNNLNKISAKYICDKLNKEVTISFFIENKLDFLNKNFTYQFFTTGPHIEKIENIKIS